MDPLKHIFSLVYQGDKDAFKLLFDSFYPRLLAFSVRIVKEDFYAEEIVEEMFVKLWKNRNKLHKINYPKSYFYKMVYNASIDYLKKNKKNVPLNLEIHDSSTALNEYFIEEEVHNILIRAMDSLPYKCRKVFELSCFEKLPYKDIAEDLQISVNTVKSQRSRAIELLKFQLKDYSFLLGLIGII